MEFNEIIRKQDESYIFIKPIGEVRIDLEFFADFKRLASMVGDKVEVFGVFYLYFWDDINDKEDGKKPKKILFQIPAMITMCPSYIEQRGAECILEFQPGDIFIEQYMVVQTIENQKKIMNMLFNKYIPDSVKYSDIFKLWESCKNVNKINLKSPSSLLELIVSEMCRNPENLNESFRMYLKKNPNGDESSRVLVNLMALPRYLSTFASISSADPKAGVTKSIVRQREGEKNIISPVEEAVR